MTKRCALLTDMSSLGKSSLTVMIPALEMLGVEACPVPTALLSTQSDGFVDFYKEDGTVPYANILDHWLRMGYGFDGIYSGYFTTVEEVDKCASFVKANPSALYLCDPVLGDDGALYQGMEPALTGAIRDKLMPLAAIVTPNPTEAGLLLGRKGMPDASWCAGLGGKHTMITGVKTPEGWAILLDGEALPFEHLPSSLPGAGDLYAAILLALLVRGKPLREAAQKAATLVFLAMERTVRERKWGVEVSSIRKELAAV